LSKGFKVQLIASFNTSQGDMFMITNRSTLLNELSQEVEASLSGGVQLQSASIRAVAAKAAGSCHSPQERSSTLGFSLSL